MGLFKTLKQSKEAYAKQRAETKGYRRIVAEKTKLAARQAYAEEAIKVARERAIAKARAPTFGQRLAGVAKKKLAPQPVRTTSPRRTVRVAKTKTKKAAKKRYAPAPTYQAPKMPTNLNQAIYGGY